MGGLGVVVPYICEFKLGGGRGARGVGGVDDVGDLVINLIFPVHVHQTHVSFNVVKGDVVGV